MAIPIQQKKRPRGAKGPSRAELIFIFIITLFIPNAGYIIFNMPQLFEDIMIHQFQIKPVQFEAMYTVYSVPNFVSLPLGSLALSYTGLGLGTVLFGGIINTGLLIMYIGFLMNNYIVVLIGRGIFGTGAETIMITAPAIFGKWFMGKALSISQASNRAFINAGISLSVIVGPGLFVKYRSMDQVFMFYGALVFISFVFSAMYAIFEINYERRNKIDLSRHGSVLELEAKKSGSMKSICKEEDLLDERDKIFKAGDVRCFTPTFWYLAVIYTLGTNIYMMFNTFATDFFMNRFAYQYTEATNMFAIFQISCIFMIPVMSFLTTAYGYKGYLLLLTNVVGAATFFGFSLLPPEPNKTLHAGFMLGYAFFASLLLALIWPCMTLAVPSRGAAFAFGMATTVQNVLIASLPLYFGAVNLDRSVRSYNLSLYSLAGMCVFTGVLSLFVTHYDIKKGGKLLHLPENSKKVSKLRDQIEENYYKYKLEQKDAAMTADYKTMANTVQTESRRRDTEDPLASTKKSKL